jgi:hypothetical protein
MKARSFLASLLGSARASRADCGASPQSDLLNSALRLASAEKLAMAGAPSPAREARALPNVCRDLAHAIAALCSFAIFGCESTTNYVPSVTPDMAAGKKEKQVNLVTLNEGRTLFVHRCIECHTLPPLWHYTVQDWREIVKSMSHRASLSPAEREAIVAYIIAVRRQSR